MVENKKHLKNRILPLEVWSYNGPVLNDTVFPRFKVQLKSPPLSCCQLQIFSPSKEQDKLPKNVKIYLISWWLEINVIFANFYL